MTTTTTATDSPQTSDNTRIKAAIFDIDGTLADSVPLIIASFRKAIEPLVGRPLSDEEIMDSFGPDEEGSVRSFVPDDYMRGTALFLEQYEAMHDMCTSPFECMAELLQTLKAKGVRLAVATGKGAYTTDLTLGRFQLTSFFEKIENGSPEGSRKVEAIHQILQAFGVSGENVIYIGDSKSDIEESKAAGVRAIAAAWASTAKKDDLKAAEPDAFFETVDDFARWLEKLVAKEHEPDQAGS